MGAVKGTAQATAAITDETTMAISGELRIETCLWKPCQTICSLFCETFFASEGGARKPDLPQRRKRHDPRQCERACGDENRRSRAGKRGRLSNERAEERHTDTPAGLACAIQESRGEA